MIQPRSNLQCVAFIKKGWAGLTDIDVVATSVELLVETRHCRKVDKQPNQNGGRPTDSYCWNPLLQKL